MHRERPRSSGIGVAGFPLFAEEGSDGWLTVRHVDELRALDDTRTHLQLIEAQEYLVDAARNKWKRDRPDAA